MQETDSMTTTTYRYKQSLPFLSFLVKQFIAVTYIFAIVLALLLRTERKYRSLDIHVGGFVNDT